MKTLFQKRPRWLALFVFLLCLLGVGTAVVLNFKKPHADAKAGPSTSTPSAGTSPAINVGTFVALQQNVPVVLEVNSNVLSLNVVEVHPQVSQLIDKVHVKEGQFVKANTLLFSLDDRADRANLEKALAQQSKNQAVLEDLERQYQRGQSLLSQKFVAPSFVDNLQSQVQAQKATVAADKAAVKLMQVNLAYNQVYAPVSGRIGAINVFRGSLVQPASALLTITQLDPIALAFSVPEKYLQDVLSAAKNQTEVTALLPDGSAVQGHLNFVDNTVDTATGTVRAKARFENKAQKLWPGQYLNARLTLRTLENATVVPSASLLQRPSGTSVYVVNADRKVSAKPVEVLYAFEDKVALKGILPGDNVVVEGKQNLSPGSKVRLAASAPPTSTPASPPSSH